MENFIFCADIVKIDIFVEYLLTEQTELIRKQKNKQKNYKN